MEPVVSLIIPVYNCEKYLEKALLSAKNQDCGELEIIAVEDCSTDGSRAILDKTDGIVKLYHERNMGLSASRNDGMDIARGEYVCFMDADDFIEKDHVSRLLKGLKEKNTDWAITSVCEEHISEKGTEQRSIRAEEGVYSGKKILLELEKQTLLGYAWNKMYKKSIIDAHKLRFEQTPLIEDILFNLKYASFAERVYICGEPTYHYARRQEASLTHKVIPDYIGLQTRRIEETEAFFADTEGSTEALAAIYARYLLSFCERLYSAKEKNKCRQVRAVREKEVYRRLSPYFPGLKKKLLKLPLLTGFLLYILKKYLHPLFEKMSR